MSKKMLINATHPEENRVAIVDDGILTELDIEIAGKEQTKGNIYKAAVVRVEPGLQAAFIDYGGERFGFLQMGEIHPSYFPNGDGESRGRRITDVLRRGQELLVQVVKEERGTKGAALTTFLSLPGRFMVLMPDSDTKGVSRKIEDESQRKKLKEAMASLDLPGQMGYIVRTAGIGQKKEELRRDFNYLVRVYEKIREQARVAKAPSLIYKESNLVIRSLRDYFSADMDEVLVDDPRVCQEAKDFFQEVMPEYARLVKLHQEKRPIFARYQIEEQIETITKNKVQLPSGGSIVIDATEALVAVDVNSGKMAGESNVETTAYKSNLEAAAETARQLRLRDLGGLIVIDFIDMRDRKHIREVEKCLKDSLKYDKARVTVGRISQFGLLEMSRQRIKATLAEGSFLPCPHCSGSGKVKSAEAQAIAFLRKVHGAIAKGQVGRVEGEVPLEVATYLLNFKREELLDMERLHQMVIVIKGRPDFLPGQVELTTQRRAKEEFVTLEPPSPLPAVQPPQPLPASPAQEAAVPAEEIESPAAPVEAQPTEADAEGRKKRKRKRKKKKPEDILAALESAAELTAGLTELSEQSETPPVASTQEGEEAGLAAVSADTGEGREERKKKRRRRRKKKTPQEAMAETAEMAELQEAAPETLETATEALEEAPGPETLAPEPPSVTQEPAAEPFPTGGPEEPSFSEQTAGEESAGEGAPEKESKSRRRRRRKKPATVAPMESSVAAAATAADQQTTGTEAAGEPPAAPAEAEPGTPVTIPTTPAETEFAAPPEAEPAAPPETEPVPTAKSRPRRSPRAKAKATEQEGAVPAAGEASAEPAKRPARSPRRRAKPADADESAAAAPTAEPAPAAAETPAGSRPKSRPSRKKTAAKEPPPETSAE